MTEAKRKAFTEAACSALPCPFASQVAKKIRERAEKGLQKYGVTCERNDLSISDWLTHLQEELMDAAVYIEKSKYEIWRAAEDSK